MPKGSGNRIIPDLRGSGLWRQYAGWKGASISLNMTQENPNTVEPLRVLEAHGGKDHPHWVINCLQENSTSGYWAIRGTHPNLGHIQILITLTPPPI